MTWMDDHSARLAGSKWALIPQIQTGALSHRKKNRPIPRVLLEAEQAEGKSLFQQPVMMISHNLGDRLHIGQTRRHPQRERWPAVPAAHTEQIDCVSCRDLGGIFDVCVVIMWTRRHTTPWNSKQHSSQSCSFLTYSDRNLFSFVIL